jgi:hypothetical protein
MWWGVHNDGIIGYCGVEHISWYNGTGEASFLLDENATEYWPEAFRAFIRKAFDATGLQAIYAEVYHCSENRELWALSAEEHHAESVTVPCRRRLGDVYHGADIHTFLREVVCESSS